MESAERIARALENGLISPNETDSNFEAANLTDGLFAMARQLTGALNCLGTGNAATSMGAIELLSMQVRDAGMSISAAILELADAIRESSK